MRRVNRCLPCLANIRPAVMKSWIHPVEAIFRRSFHVKSQIVNKSTESSDILIVGGGIMGLSTAYWIKDRSPETSITVIEKDPQYRTCSTTRAAGGIRSHFSLPENIKLSLFSFDFMENVEKYLSIADDEDDLDIGLVRKGYLYLATEKGRDCLLENHQIQIECGAKTILLNSSELKQRFPWLNTDDIVLGSYAVDKEGWLDPYRLLMAFRSKVRSLGVNYVQGCVTDFVRKNADEIDGAKVELPKDEGSKLFQCQKMIIAGGYECGALSRKLAGKAFEMICPVNPRKRYIFSFKCDGLDGREFPMLIDPSGVYCRGDGFNFITGLSPEKDQEPDTSNLDVDYDFFDQEIWPRLAGRVAKFESLKVLSAWAGYYDFNELDENAIIGLDPVWRNIYWATGFSGHGLQMAPAVGKVLSELILDGKYLTVDCSRFGFTRVLEKKKLLETNII